MGIKKKTVSNLKVNKMRLSEDWTLQKKRLVNLKAWQ